MRGRRVRGEPRALRAGTPRPFEQAALPHAFAFAQRARSLANRRWVENELRSRTIADVAELTVELAPELDQGLASPDGGALAQELRRLRWHLWETYGVALPPIALRPSPLPERTYLVRVDQVAIAGMQLPLDALFVHGQREQLAQAGIPFEATNNPLNGRPAAWIQKEHADALRAAHIFASEAPFALRLHVQAILEARLGGFLSHQDVADLLGIHLPEEEAATVASQWLTPLTSVVRALLQERVPVRSMPAIVEGLRDGMSRSESVAAIAERVRCHDAVRYGLPGLSWRTRYLRLTPVTEAMLAKRLRTLNGQAVLAIEPEVTQEFLAAVRTAVQSLEDSGWVAVLVENPDIRPHMRALVELEFPHLPVVAWRELDDWMRERVIVTLDEVDGGDA